MLVEIAFKGNRKEFFTWDLPEGPAPRVGVIVEADRGEDFGRVYATGELAEKRAAGVPHAPTPETPVRKALRLATRDDERRARELRTEDDSARRTAMERVKANGLVMKLSDAEWQWDRRKLTLYFTAEKRVDFRTLVRDLAAIFRTRIELKQIGVRDEARRLDGIGRCGRQYCSASFLPELRPVNLGVAKDQRLSLNPSQISGACGRLMCSLRFEHAFYVESRRRFPKEGRILVTSRGEEKVIANDIFNNRVTLRSAEGDSRVVLLEELRAEGVAGVPTEAEVARAARPLASQAAERGGRGDRGAQGLDDDGDQDDRPALAQAGPVPGEGVTAAMSETPAAPVPAFTTPAAPVPTGSSPAPASASAETPDANRNGERRGRRRRGKRGGRRNRDAGPDDRSGQTPPATE